MTARQRLPLLKSAAAWSARLQLEQDNALSSLIDRVDLDQDGMRLSLKLPLSNAESGAPDGSSHLSIERRVPMQLRRRGVELRLVINGNGGAGASCKTDQSLLRAVARAHCWFDDLGHRQPLGRLLGGESGFEPAVLTD